MTKPRALVLVLNTYRHDNRVERTSELLVDQGFETTVIALQNGYEKPNEKKSRHSVVRVGATKSRIRNWALNLAAETHGKRRRLSLKVRLGISSVFFSVDTVMSLLFAIIRATSTSKNEYTGGRIGRTILRIVETQFTKHRETYLAFADHALKIAESVRPALVVANDLPTLPAALAIHEKLGAQFIYDSHELWLARNKPRQATSPLEISWESETEKKGLKKALFSVTVCDSIADHLSRFYSVNRPLVVRNIPARPESSPDRPAPSIRKLCSAAPDDFLCVYVGGITENRSLDEAICALSSLPRKVKLLLLGPVSLSYLPVLVQLIKDRGLGDRVSIPGSIPGNTLVQALKEADLSLILVKPVCLSYFYALPNKLFESMSAGLPMVGSRLPEIEALVEKTGTGICYEPGNAEDLSRSIRLMMDDKALRSTCAAKSAALSELHTWDEEAEKFGAQLCASIASAKLNLK